MTQTKTNKHCVSCYQDLPYSDFYRNISGYSSKCKPCTIAHNTEYRKNRGPKPRPRRVPLVDVHRKLLSGLGPGIAVLHGRYVHGYKNFSLYLGPWGLLLDGELLYGDHSIDDILYILSTRHMKLMRRDNMDISLEEVLDKVLLLRNSCGVPIDVRFVKSLVFLDQYFLWMDKPRKLLISEVSHQLSISEDLILFLLGPQKNTALPKIVPPANFEISSETNPQHIEFTFVEE